MAIALALYVLVSSVGFAVYGQSLTQAGGDILDRLPYSPASLIAWILIVIHFLGGFAVCELPCVEGAADIHPYQVSAPDA